MDLLQLSSVSDRIHRLIVDRIFNHRYRDMVIEFGNVLLGNAVHENKIRFGDMGTQLQFLESFGHLIRHLAYGFSGADHAVFNEYVEKYLSPDVEIIDIIGNSEHLLLRTNRTFAQVEKLRLYHGDQTFAPQIHRIFPHLRHVSVHTSDQRPLYSDPYERFLRQLLQPVRNLSSLSIGDIRDGTLLPLIRANNPTLNALTVGGYIGSFEGAAPIHFQTVAQFRLKLLGRSGRHELRSTFPITFDELKALEVDAIVLDDHLIVRNLIERNVALESVSFMQWKTTFTIVSMLRRVNATHTIQEVAFQTDGEALSSDDGIALMSDFPHLKTITFFVHDESMEVSTSPNHDRVVASIRPEWRVASITRDVSFLGLGIVRHIRCVRV